MTPPAAARALLSPRRASAIRVAALFDQHASMVLGLCRLLLRDHHEAEDAAQQTFVSAYRSLLRGTEPREEGAWLAAIARNECRARIRTRLAAPVALDGELTDRLADPADVADVADRRAELAEITRILAGLPLRQREAVALRDFLGLSYEEVASTLAVSVPVVESLLFRARQRLRDSVRAVPRYAAGAAAVPLALRAAVARDIPDFDSVRASAGLLAGATAALGAAVAKVVSLPFAAKTVTATAVAVVAAGTAVAPQISDPGLEQGAPASVAAQQHVAQPAATDVSLDVLAPQSPSAHSPDDGARPTPEAPAIESGSDEAPAAEPEPALDPDRTAASAPGGDPPAPPTPPVVDDGPVCDEAAAASEPCAADEEPAEDTAEPPAEAAPADTGPISVAPDPSLLPGPTGDEPTGDEPAEGEPTGEEPTGEEPAGEEPAEGETGEEPAVEEPAEEPVEGETGEEPAAG